MNCLRLNKPIIKITHKRLARKTRAVTYSDFLTKVNHGDITDVAIFPGSPDIRFLDSDGMVDTAKVILNDSFINELRDHAVNIQIANPPVDFFKDIFPF